MTKTYSMLALLLTLPTFAAAQSVSSAQPSPPRFGLGLGMGVSESPYAGEGLKITPLPLIHYEGERLFFQGLTGGVHLWRSQSFALDAIASLRMDGIDAKDFGKKELARNGIQRSLLEDRDNGLDMGLAASWRGAAGHFELTAQADVSGSSEGFELGAKYAYEFDVGNGSLTPSISVSYLSKDMANYYYGTLKEEVARGVVNYQPGAVTLPTLGLSYTLPLSDHWQFMSAVQYKFLPSDISDSPLVESGTRGEGTVAFGISRSF